MGFNLLLTGIIAFLTSTEVQENLFWLRMVFFAVAGFLGTMTIFLLIKSSWLRYRILEDLAAFLTFKPYGLSKTMRRWNKIVQKLKLGSEETYKTTVVEADQMMDEVLKKMGYSGENLKERLDKIAPSLLPSKEQVYRAHRIRDNIIEDPNFRLSLEQAQEILKIFEQALISELQAF